MIKKILTLTILYFVQGLPYGFQDKFIPMYLRLSGLSHTKLSLMKLLLIPWLCKAVFAPLIDLVWTKRFWLLCSLCLLMVTAFLGIFIETDCFLVVALWIFVLNLLSAFQDVAVDGLALNILQDKEIGHGNTAQVIGYKLGALCGGGFLFWIHFYYGWIGLCLLFSLLYAFSILMFLPVYGDSEIIKRKPSYTKRTSKGSLKDEQDALSTNYHLEGVRKRSVQEIISEVKTELVEKYNEQTEDFCSVFKNVFQSKGTFFLLLFLVIYKLGERGASSIFPLFLVDQGISTKQVAFWNGLIGQSISLFGSVCGGWMVSQDWNLKYLILWICLARIVPIFLQWIIILIWDTMLFSFLHNILIFIGIASLLSLEFAGGLMTTLVFSLMMTSSLKAPAAVQSTHYSVLSSFEVAGKLLFASIAGALIDLLGLSFVYMGFILFSLMTVLVIPSLDC